MHNQGKKNTIRSHSLEDNNRENTNQGVEENPKTFGPVQEREREKRQAKGKKKRKLPGGNSAYELGWGKTIVAKAHSPQNCCKVRGGKMHG